jgi:hypothetical protein
LNVADTPEEARAFVERYGWTWPSIRDRERRLARSLGAEYQPHVIAVDADGRIAGSFEGGGEDADWETLAELVS